ncbi:hypothetical protein [Mycobacterium sp. ACS4331]|uniref:hypothetical protein n=1 Tax=Mycobacterium sp. ACS4331 TaxID=1834121 RepID=UPI0007FF1E38|nr:hypothetical protein [Mycobacterium sp. ACS4331]OBF14475.1 hypothetical protein A5727_15610 [Mycobacterium sp. ACS4331]
MEISARSYLTAGMALTAASAIALTPVVVTPTHDRNLTIPSVSVPDVQLSAAIDDAAIAEFIAALNAGLADVVATVDAVAAIPGQTLLGVLDEASSLNTALWDTLIEAASGSQTLSGLLTLLAGTSQAGFDQLLVTVGGTDEIISLLPGTVTDIIGSTLIGTLSTALYAIADVVNNPLALSSYTGLLGAGVETAAGVAYGGIDLVNEFGFALFGYNDGEVQLPGLLGINIDGVQGQFNIALGGLSALLDGVATASGSQIVEGVVAAVQGLAIAPISAVVNASAGAANSVVNALSDGFFTISDGAWYAVAEVEYAITGALDAIGNAPLDPASYTTALSSLISGGFGVFNTAVFTAGDLAKVPVNLASNLTVSAAALITDLTSGLATAVSGLLTAVGLPAEVADLPVALAATINSVVNEARDLALGGLAAVDSLIDTGVGTVITVSNAIEDAITGALTTVGEALPDLTPEAPAAGDAGLRTALVAVENETVVETEVVETEVVTDKEIVAVDDSASGEETSVVVTDPKDLADAPSTGVSDGGSGTEAPAKKTAKEKREAAKADREAAKAERAEQRSAAKAERAAKRDSAKAERAAKRDSASSSASAE